MSPLSIASELGQRPGDVLTQLKERSYNNAHAPYQLRELAPVLHKVFSHIQGLECVVDEEITEPFSVESREDAVGSFPRRVFHTPNTFDDDATFSERGPDY